MYCEAKVIHTEQKNTRVNRHKETHAIRERRLLRNYMGKIGYFG